jgi:hypothetical protein
MGRACSTHGERRNAYRVLIGNPEGKRLLGKLRRRWEDNIKMDLRVIRIRKEYKSGMGVMWTELTWLRMRTSGGLL